MKFIETTVEMPWVFWANIASGIFLLLFALWKTHKLKKLSEGNETMRQQGGLIRSSAKVYLKLQAKLIVVVFIILTTIVGFQIWQGKQEWPTLLGVWTGGMGSFLNSYLAMIVATYANTRVANAARSSLAKGHNTAINSGSIFGSTTVGLVILDINIWYFILKMVFPELDEVMRIMLSFGVGASTQAYFARVGGGIFTKAADMAADLAGKNGYNLPEDHVTNCAVTADNVGDNVGDIGGMGPDLFESKVATLLSSMLLGALLFKHLPSRQQEIILLFPSLISGIGAVLSNIGISIAKIRKNKNETTKAVNQAMARGALFSVVFMIPILIGVSSWLEIPNYFIQAIAAGLVGALVLGGIVNYFTSYDFAPVQKISQSFHTSAATGIVKGVGYGFYSVAPVFLVVIFLMWICIQITPEKSFLAVTHTMSLSALGMMMIINYVLAIDFYGPVSDNAGGIAETVSLPPEVRKRTDILDAVGNSTAAICKGFAFGSAAMAAVALLSSYPQEIHKPLDTLVFNFDFILGFFSAAIVVGVVIHLLSKGVSDAADKLITEVNRQIKVIQEKIKGSGLKLAELTFENVPRIKRNDDGVVIEDGLDPEGAVAIATKAAQKNTMAPTLVVLIFTILVRMAFGSDGGIGYIFGMIPLSLVVAIFMSNSGGAWDNGKKLIEATPGMKGSDAHKNAVIGDTVGDPFKDTIGPAFNIMMKWPILILILLG